MSNADIVIVGAGPAGTAAAIRCALAGVSVILLERAEFPRHRPGETLHPGVEPLLKQLGVWERVERAGFVRHTGIRVCSAGHETVAEFGSDANGQWFGLQAWRAEFDRILLDRAIELGVCVIQPLSAQSALIENSIVVGVESDRGRIKADFMIDAAGGRHWLAKQLNTPMQTDSPPLFARYGYVEGDYSPANDLPVLRVDADSWTWIARVRERTFQWTKLSLNRQVDGRVSDDVSEVPSEFKHLESIGHVCGANVTWRCATVPAGPGYFLCGDAAAVLDPASSHGVLKGLMSGIYAGHLIEQLHARQKSEIAAAAEYSDWLTRWFQHDVVELRKRYSEMGLVKLINTQSEDN
jgi:flavin-dependent dehydrogenase